MGRSKQKKQEKYASTFLQHDSNMMSCSVVCMDKWSESEALKYVTGGKTRTEFDQLRDGLGFGDASDQEYHQYLGL